MAVRASEWVTCSGVIVDLAITVTDVSSPTVRWSLSFMSGFDLWCTEICLCGSGTETGSFFVAEFFAMVIFDSRGISWNVPGENTKTDIFTVFCQQEIRDVEWTWTAFWRERDASSYRPIGTFRVVSMAKTLRIWKIESTRTTLIKRRRLTGDLIKIIRFSLVKKRLIQINYLESNNYGIKRTVDTVSNCTKRISDLN